MRRRTVIWAAAIVVVVAAAAGTVIWAVTRPAGPEEAVQRYLDAIVSGDADGAIGLLAGEHDGDVLHDAFAGATSYPASATVDDRTGDRTFTVSYVIGDEPLTATLTLDSTDAGWRVIDGALATASVTVDLGTHVAIGSADVPAGTSVELLPGVYPVGPVPADLLDGSSEIVAAPGEDATATLEASLSPDAERSAQEQVDAYADACTKAADAVPEHCGIVVPWPADLEELGRIEYRIEQMPAVTLDLESGAFEATGGILVATASGIAHGGGTQSFTYRSDRWALFGDLRIDGDRLVLAVR